MAFAPFALSEPHQVTGTLDGGIFAAKGSGRSAAATRQFPLEKPSQPIGVISGNREAALAEILAEGSGVTARCSYDERFEFGYVTRPVYALWLFNSLSLGHSR